MRPSPCALVLTTNWLRIFSMNISGLSSPASDLSIPLEWLTTSQWERELGLFGGLLGPLGGLLGPLGGRWGAS